MDIPSGAKPVPADALPAPTPDLADRVVLTGITGFGRHGVYDNERTAGQRFVVDLICWLDLSRAAATDDLSQTIDYAGLATAVVEEIEGEAVDLLETLAGRIADRSLTDQKIRQVAVTVHKPDVDMPVPVADVAVTVQRSADQ